MAKRQVKSVTNLYKEDLQNVVLPLLNNPLGNINGVATPHATGNDKILGNINTPTPVVKPLLGGNVYDKTDNKPNVTAQLLKKVNGTPAAIEKLVTLDYVPMTVYTYTVPSDIGNVNFSEPRQTNELDPTENVNTGTTQPATDTIVDTNVNAEGSDLRPAKVDEIKDYNLNQELNDQSESNTSI